MATYCQRCEATVIPPKSRREVKRGKEKIHLAMCHACQKVINKRKWKEDQKRYPF